MAEGLAGELGVERGSGRSLGWWGTALLIATEGVLFALLLFVWLYLRTQADSWPPEGVRDPELVTVSIRTALLLASSATMLLAERGVRSGSRARLYVGLVATLLLAAVFLAGHVDETIKVLREYTWSDHAYGSARYTILNFHAAHLLVGMGVLGFVLLARLRGRYEAGEGLSVRLAGLYWHFVDLVWAVVFLTLYVLPNVT